MEKKIKQALIKLGWVNPVGLTINLRDDELTIRCMVDGVREIKQSKQPSNCDLPQVSARLTIEELIWLKKFPEESFNANDFYDWAKENEGEAFALCLKIASSLNVR